MTVHRNVENLFDPDRLSQISTHPEWKSAPLESARRSLEELLEKREAMIEEGLDAKETAYYWTSYVLRRLGFCFSVVERTGGEEDTRPDFTLFYDATEFLRARDYRGTRDFFANSLCVMRTLGWGEEFNHTEDPETGAVSNPAVDLDRYMRTTGVPWGILTNGPIWRLYNRDTSGLLNTFYEVDLVSALQSNDLDDFRYFWMVFSPAGLGGSTRGDAIVTRLYD